MIPNIASTVIVEMRYCARTVIVWWDTEKRARGYIALHHLYIMAREGILWKYPLPQILYSYFYIFRTPSTSRSVHMWTHYTDWPCCLYNDILKFFLGEIWKALSNHSFPPISRKYFSSICSEKWISNCCSSPLTQVFPITNINLAFQWSDDGWKMVSKCSILVAPAMLFQHYISIFNNIWNHLELLIYWLLNYNDGDFYLGSQVGTALAIRFQHHIFQYELWIWDIVIGPLPYIALKLVMTIYHPIGFHRENFIWSPHKNLLNEFQKI